MYLFILRSKQIFLQFLIALSVTILFLHKNILCVACIQTFSTFLCLSFFLDRTLFVGVFSSYQINEQQQKFALRDRYRFNKNLLTVYATNLTELKGKHNLSVIKKKQNFARFKICGLIASVLKWFSRNHLFTFTFFQI